MKGSTPASRRAKKLSKTTGTTKKMLPRKPRKSSKRLSESSKYLSDLKLKLKEISNGRRLSYFVVAMEKFERSFKTARNVLDVARLEARSKLAQMEKNLRKERIDRDAVKYNNTARKLFSRKGRLSLRGSFKRNRRLEEEMFERNRNSLYELETLSVHILYLTAQLSPVNTLEVSNKDATKRLEAFAQDLEVKKAYYHDIVHGHIRVDETFRPVFDILERGLDNATQMVERAMIDKALAINVTPGGATQPPAHPLKRLMNIFNKKASMTQLHQRMTPLERLNLEQRRTSCLTRRLVNDCGSLAREKLSEFDSDLQEQANVIRTRRQQLARIDDTTRFY